MMRLPMVPDDWLAGDANEPAAPADGGAPDSGEPLTITGLLQAAASQPMRSNALLLMMDPSEIATIPGLPAHYYEDGPGMGAYADQRAAAAPAGMAIGQVDPDHLALGHPDGNSSPASGPKNPIGPVQGYPETGKNAWRAGNDDAIVAAANKYNSEHGYLPGDVEYMSPPLMKTWQMRESGGTRQAFETDPFQVNNRRDWAPEKGKIAGLTEGQSMTPQTSADAALKWLQHKGTIHAADGSAVSYRGPYEALRKYNAKSGFVNGIPKDVDYANDVLNRAWASYGDWQK